MKKVSNDIPFVTTNLVKYNFKSHNTNSIPKQFIGNDVRYNTEHKHYTPASCHLSQNKTIQWLILVTTLVATVSKDLVRRLSASREKCHNTRCSEYSKGTVHDGYGSRTSGSHEDRVWLATSE